MTDEFRRAVRDGYDAIAPFYSDHRSAVGDEQVLLDEFCDMVRDGSTVLDAGCGEGTPIAARLVERFDTVGLDISRVQVERASRNVSDAHFLCGDLTVLPFEPDTFGGIVCSHAVIHVPREEHVAVYEEFARVLEPGGSLLVTLGSGAWEGTNPDWIDSGTEMRWSFYDPDVECELLEAAGFVVETRTTIADEMGDGAFEYVLARLDG
ncbi:class I SAM-dependent methyltransferase [Haloarchaeobius sp. TZWWS8]|uniref:class I SAM-dependent methyltransferase n=1 Tax=Haloarchaeobius sp. TZWWS8 TaxID=3446121 RepID=UPI003EB976EC